MYLGEFRHQMDDKGRLFLPAPFREALGERFVVTKGLDKSLFVYDLKEWAKIEQTLRRLPFTQGDVRAFTRLFFSGANEVQLDKQGRMQLSQPLRDYSLLQKEVVILGVGTRIEIWSKDIWESYEEDANQQFATIAEKLVLGTWEE